MSRNKLLDLKRMPEGASWTLTVSVEQHMSTTRSSVVLKAYPVKGDQTRALVLFHADLRTPPPTDLPAALGMLMQAVNAAIICVASGGN